MMQTLALVNGKVITMEPVNPQSDAVLIEDGIIVAVGGSGEIARRCQRLGGEVVELGDKVAVPGLHDCHVHMMGTGLNALGIDMYDCASIQDVLDKVQEADRTYPETKWVFGKRLDESRLKEGLPTGAAGAGRRFAQTPGVHNRPRLALHAGQHACFRAVRADDRHAGRARRFRRAAERPPARRSERDGEDGVFRAAGRRSARGGLPLYSRRRSEEGRDDAARAGRRRPLRRFGYPILTADNRRRAPWCASCSTGRLRTTKKCLLRG